MKLYTFPASSNARKVEMAAVLLGVELEREVVDLAKGKQRLPDFLAINPAGKVPVLADGDFFLPESNAIMAYLADTKPGNTLYPADIRARAEVNRWLFWQSQHYGPPIGGLNFEHFIKQRFGGGEPDAGQVKRHEEAVRQAAAVLDTQLAHRQWVCGSNITLADLAIATPLMYIELAKIPVESFANIQRWFGAVRELDAWKKTEPQQRL